MNKLTVSIPMPFITNKETTMQFDPTFVGTSSVKHPISQPNTATLTNKERIMSKVHVPSVVTTKVASHRQHKEMERLFADTVATLSDPFGAKAAIDAERQATKVNPVVKVADAAFNANIASLVNVTKRGFGKVSSVRANHKLAKANTMVFVANLHNLSNISFTK